MKMFYEKDADVNLIKIKKSSYHWFWKVRDMPMHLNLKDSGANEIVVALREGSSSIKLKLNLSWLKSHEYYLMQRSGRM